MFRPHAELIESLNPPSGTAEGGKLNEALRGDLSANDPCH